MKFGFSGGNLSTNIDSYFDVVSIVKYGEELGYDTAWISDRIRDAYVTMTACAQATSLIRLCTGVVSPFMRHPVANARSFATLDEICNGRQAMSFGAGNHLAASELGFETKSSYERVKEACIITKRLFAGESVTFEGRFFRLRDTKLGMKVRPNIPIYVAGGGPKILGVAGETADGAIIPYANVDVIEHAKDSIRAGASKAGKDFSSISLVAWLPTYITKERGKVIDSLRGFAAMQVVLSPFEWLRSMGISENKYLAIKKKFSRRALIDVKLDSEFWQNSRDYISDDIVELLSLIGTAQQIISKIEDLKKHGIREFSLWIPPPTLVEKRRVLEIFAAEVMSVFQEDPK